MFQLRAQRIDQLGDHLGGRPGCRNADVDEVTLQPRPGGPPQRRSAQHRGKDRWGHAGPHRLDLALDQCPKQPGDQHDGV